MKKENTFTQVPNNLLEALCRVKLSANKKEIVLVILRYTYGYHKDSAQISYLGFSKLTGLGRRYCIKLVKNLVEGKLIIKVVKKKNYPSYFSINPNLNNWKVTFRSSDPQVTSDQLGTRGDDSEDTLNSDNGVTQEINKESKERSEKIKKRIKRMLIRKRGS